MKQTNYNKMSNPEESKPQDPKVETTEEEVTETVTSDDTTESEDIDDVQETDDDKDYTDEGKVVGCQSLNVRAEPKATSDILAVIKLDDIVKINMGETTYDFYKVLTNDGVEGFCMYPYIELI